MPAIGWPGITKTPAGAAAARAFPTSPFTEPTSVSVAPGFSPGAQASAAAPMAPGGGASTTRSAPVTASAGSATTRSAMPSSVTRSRTAALASETTMVSATAWARAARTMEEPIRPQPITAIVL